IARGGTAMPARKKPTANPAATPSPNTETHREWQPSSEAKGRVLIVEDDVLLSTVVEDALTYEGYAVVGTARSAEEAISMAVAHGPDLVLMDIRLLGNSDGIAAAGQILERTGIRCLMATGQDDAKTKARAALVQPLGWLPKPYGNEEMVQAVADALRCKSAS
ncbi:MAG TPA: response regulator, partial [Steroidobacteraceae bacterium]|nr:response regulator [Steroidobacteraceae bacterium]